MTLRCARSKDDFVLEAMSAVQHLIDDLREDLPKLVRIAMHIDSFSYLLIFSNDIKGTPLPMVIPFAYGDAVYLAEKEELLKDMNKPYLNVELRIEFAVMRHNEVLLHLTVGNREHSATLLSTDDYVHIENPATSNTLTHVLSWRLLGLSGELAEFARKVAEEWYEEASNPQG